MNRLDRSGDDGCRISSVHRRTAVAAARPPPFRRRRLLTFLSLRALPQPPPPRAPGALCRLRLRRGTAARCLLRAAAGRCSVAQPRPRGRRGRRPTVARGRGPCGWCSSPPRWPCAGPSSSAPAYASRSQTPPHGLMPLVLLH